MKTIMRKALAVAVLAGVSGGVMARDGTLGGDQDGNPITGNPGASRGDFLIQLTRNALTRIWGLDDFTFNNVLTNSNVVEACVYSNSGSGNYSLQATSANSNNFALTGGTGPDISYIVTFDDGSAPSVTNGTVGNFSAGAIAGQPDPDASTCPSGSSNLSISVALDSSITDINSVLEGTYSDTVTVTVSPR